MWHRKPSSAGRHRAIRVRGLKILLPEGVTPEALEKARVIAAENLARREARKLAGGIVSPPPELVIQLKHIMAVLRRRGRAFTVDFKGTSRQVSNKHKSAPFRVSLGRRGGTEYIRVTWKGQEITAPLLWKTVIEKLARDLGLV